MTTIDLMIKKYDKNRYIGEYLFLTAYSLFIVQILFQSTLYIDKYSLFNAVILHLMRCVAYFILLTKLGIDFLSKRFTIKEILGIAAAAIVFLYVAKYSTRKDILIFWIFIAGTKEVCFKNIVKASLIIHVIFIATVILSSFAGIVNDRTFIRHSTKAVRHSYGFKYSAQPAHYLFYTILMWIYVRRERVTLLEIIVMFAATVFMYISSDTKSPFGLSIIGLCGAVVLKYSEYFRRYKKWYSIVAITAIPVCAVTMFILCYNDAWQDQAWMHKLNELVSGRMRLTNQGFHLFGIKAFGQTIEWFGGPIEYYHYVDSAYMNVFFNLGWITYILVVLWGAHCGYEASKNKDTYYVLSIALVAIHSMFDVTYAMIDYNVFITMYTNVDNCMKTDKMNNI